MLIDHYDLDIFTPPCEPGAERFTAIARLKADISPLLPYLNATSPGAIYHPAASALTWKKAGHAIVFRNFEIGTSNVADRDAALKELDELVALANSTWEHRQEITPSFETRQRPTPMEVSKLLPRTNCKQCGEPTCWTFALKLVAGQKLIADCPPLGEARFASQLAALEEMAFERHIFPDR
jgi:ArsR family metal-binding transcriptional regulator